jgi:AraC family transcriptional regulator
MVPLEILCHTLREMLPAAEFTTIPATQIPCPPDCELSEGVFPAGLKLKFSPYEEAYVCFIIEGALTDIHPSRTITYGSGTLIVFPDNRRHVVEATGPTRCLIVRVGKEKLARLGTEIQKLAEPFALQGWEADWLAHRLYAEFLKSTQAQPRPTLNRALIVEGIVLQLLALAARAGRQRRVTGETFWLKRVRELIDAQFLREFRLGELAALAGVHRVHLVREFRRRYGTTIGQRIRNLRFEHACGLLNRSNLSLREIAAACRFTDQSHFSKQFKKLSGLTPAEYRNFVRSCAPAYQRGPNLLKSA